MRSLSVKLFVSHVAIAVIASTIVYLFTRLLMPPGFDKRSANVHDHLGPTRHGFGAGFRQVAIEATNQALLIGVVVAVVVAALATIFMARRIITPIMQLSATTRRMATGDYRVHLNAQKTNELEELRKDITTLATRLAKSEQRRRELLGEVAHELRTPVTIINGNLEGIADGVVAADEETIALLQHELVNISKLANDLSELSSSQEYVLPDNPEVVDLLGVVSEVVASFSVLAEQNQISLQAINDPASSGNTSKELQVVGDRRRLTQALTNVVKNAIEACQPEGAVSVFTTANRDEASITVDDNGYGIDESELDLVFDRFYRSARNTKSGSGIGLAIVRDVIWAHKGRVTISSDGIGKGTCVNISLPLANNQEPPAVSVD